MASAKTFLFPESVRADAKELDMAAPDLRRLPEGGHTDCKNRRLPSRDEMTHIHSAFEKLSLN
jgi:hypothetical protein